MSERELDHQSGGLFFSFNQPAWFLPSVNSVVTSEIQLFRVDFGSTGRIKEVEERRNAGRTRVKRKRNKKLRRRLAESAASRKTRRERKIPGMVFLCKAKCNFLVE